MEKVRNILNPNGDLDLLYAGIFCLFLGGLVHYAFLAFLDDGKPTLKYTWLIVGVMLYLILIVILSAVRFYSPFGLH